MVSQANKKNEIEKIYLISHDITRLEQAQQALNHRFEYETMLSQISKDALSVNDSRHFIETSLNQLAVGTDVDRIFLFINMSDGRHAKLEYEWVSDNCRPLEGKVIDYAHQASWKKRLQANEEIYYTGQPKELEMLSGCPVVSKEETRAILLVPLTIQQHFYGFMGLEERKIAREWLPEDINLIRMAAHIFEIRLEKDIEATHRQLVEQQLFESEKKYRRIVTDVPIGILHLSTNGHILDANPYTLNIFNVQSADSLHQVMLEEETAASDLISYLISLAHQKNRLKNHEIQTYRSDGKPIILQVNASIQRNSGEFSIINAVLEDVTDIARWNGSFCRRRKWKASVCLPAELHMILITC